MEHLSPEALDVLQKALSHGLALGVVWMNRGDLKRRIVRLERAVFGRAAREEDSAPAPHP